MILIVDDSALFRLNVREAIKGAFDIEIFEAESIRGMQEYLSSTPIEDIALIILDLNLPDGNGLAAIKNYLDRNPGNKLPFIIVSKEINRAIVPLAKKYGAGDILAKPINPDDLVKTIIELYPQSFIPLEKRDKQIEEYKGIIRIEMKKAQKGSYQLSLFVIEVEGAPQQEKKEVVSRTRRQISTEEKNPSSLKSRLDNSELSLIFPIAENSCLVLMPYVGVDNNQSTRGYLIEILENAGYDQEETRIVVGSAVYPDQGDNFNDLITFLKLNLDEQYSED